MTQPASDQTEATRQNTLSWQARQDIVDYLRGRPEPIVANTKTEAAAIVATAAGVDVSAKQLWYLMGQLPKLKLEEKFQIGVLTEPQEMMRRDIAELGKEVEALSELLDDNLSDVAASIAETQGRVHALESREDAILKGQQGLIDAVHNLVSRIDNLELIAHGHKAVSSRTPALPGLEVAQPGAHRTPERDESGDELPPQPDSVEFPSKFGL